MTELTARQKRQIRGKLLRAVEAKLTMDIRAYLRDYELLVAFTASQGGSFSIGIEALLPDGTSAYEALQRTLHPEGEPVAPVPDADAPALPKIHLVSR